MYTINFPLYVCLGYLLSCGVSGILHNPLLLSLGTWMIISTLHLIFTSCYFKSAVYPTSHRCQFRQVRYVWDWVWCGPHMLPQSSLGNIVYMACFVSWFFHLVIAHELVVLYMLMDNALHPLVNKLTEFYANKIINQTPIKINKIGLPDIGATCHYLQVDATHCPSTYRGPPIHMQLPNGKTMKQSKPCILDFPDLTE